MFTNYNKIQETPGFHLPRKIQMSGKKMSSVQDCQKLHME